VFLCCYRFSVNKDLYKTFNSINHYASNSSTPAVAAIVRWAATAQWIALATEQRQYLPRIIMITVVGATDSHSNETSRRHLTNGRDTRQAGAPGIGWGRCDACHSIVYSSVQLASLDLLLRLFTASSDSRRSADLLRGDDSCVLDWGACGSPDGSHVRGTATVEQSSRSLTRADLAKMPNSRLEVR